MAQFIPFQGIRATRDKMHLVASRSFLSYSSDDLDEKLQGNPYTYLHIIEPTQDRTLTEIERFKEVRSRFIQFQEKGILEQEKTPSYYLYRQITSEHEFIGWMGGISIEDYRKGNIKVHEHTLEKRESIFAHYLEETGVNAEPVLMFASYSNFFVEWTKASMSEHPIADFTTTDEIRHTLWVINDANSISIIQNEFSGLNQLYIADGHHRSASSERLNQLHPEWEGTHHFLTYVVSTSNLNIQPFHRALTEMDITPHELIERLNLDWEKFIYSGGEIPKGSFVLLSKGVSQGYRFKSKEVGLDPELLSNEVLGPLLGMTDLRNDKRVKFIEGPRGLDFVMEQVNNSNYEVVFLLSSVTTNELCQVANENRIMPPKSTYIEPKLRSGLVIYPIR
jgi:uncharacterized protein (DUF1015 family)